MIRGYVFPNQLASNEVDSMVFRKMLDNNDGVMNGMNLSTTATSITVGDGNMMIAGRPVGVVGGETIAVGTDVAFCKLVMEVDLSKTATVSEFSQAALKIIKSTTAYPEVTQNDMDNGGTIYQVELAQFKTGLNGLSEFTDTRTFLDIKSIYTAITEEYRAVLEELKEELKDVEAGSAYVLRPELEDYQKKITVGTEPPTGGQDGDIYIQIF